MRLQPVVKRLRLSSAMEVAASTHDLSLRLGLSLQTLLFLSASDATSFSLTSTFELDYFSALHCSQCIAFLTVAPVILLKSLFEFFFLPDDG